jgi:cystathionine beta-lyase
LDYIRANRDYAEAFIREHLPTLKVAPIEGTYLMWIDCRKLNLPTEPAKWFRENAGVAFNEGSDFGENGKGFVRMNLGCTRKTLETVLENMREALVNRA